MRNQLLRKTALADSRLARTRTSRPRPEARLVELGQELAEVLLTTDERASRGLRRQCRASVERGVLLQDRVVKLAQPWPRLDPEPLDQRSTGRLVGAECLGLTSVAVEGEHQLAAQPLSERMLCDEPLQLTDGLRVAGEREASLDELLEAGEPQLLQTCDLGLRELLVCEIGEWWASPQRECLHERVLGRRSLSRASAERPAPS